MQQSQSSSPYLGAVQQSQSSSPYLRAMQQSQSSSPYLRAMQQSQSSSPYLRAVQQSQSSSPYLRAVQQSQSSSPYLRAVQQSQSSSPYLRAMQQSQSSSPYLRAMQQSQSSSPYLRAMQQKKPVSLNHVNGEDNADGRDYKAEEEVCYLVAVVAPGPLFPSNRAGGLDPLWPIGASAKEGIHGPQQAEQPDKRKSLNRCDKKTLINVNTVCQSCTISKEVDCLAGYLKKTQGIGNRDSIRECAALECPDKARCIEDAVSGKLVCKCLPDHEADGKNCKSINPCLKQVCHQNANCAHLGPNQHQCTCHEGYQGDGQVCMPVDPCQISFGNCPPDSSVCIYDSPGKSHCQCKEGFENLVPGIGCSLIDICKTNNPCSKNANCSTIDPGTTECTCNKGYAGNGKICYGSIIERLRELNTEPGGKWTGQLSSAITLFDSSLSWPLKSLGPFTIFVPINKGFKGTSMKSLMDNQLNAQYLSKLHVIAGELNIETLKKSDIYYTLTGKSGETVFSTEDQQVKIRIHGSKKKGNVLQGDIVASNGLIHIVSKLMDNVEPTVESEKEENLMTILADNGKFNRFRSLLQKFSVAQLLEQPGPYTVFAPTNGALESMDAGTLEYLLSSELEVVSIVSSPRLTTMANQALTFNITNNGQILVNGKVILEADIEARNGRLYSLEGVLIPPSIVPVLPHRCDVTESQVKMDTFKRGCVFTSNVLGMNVPSLGCAQYCNETTTVPLCCKGFYGPVCSPCPGGFTNPCSGHGKCMDGISGNGTCICEENFRGSRCQLCSSHEKYGPNCDKKCPCIHGECDNRPESSGACKEGTCQSDYTGKFCERHTSPCGPRVQFCHAHATCDYSSGTVSCVCKQGYQGDGTTCEEVDPCSNPERGGCSVNAKCIKTGPGTHICQCLVGWRADGDECQEINNCMEPNRGGCHENANCIYIGPGQELSAIPDAVEFTKWVNAAEIYEILSEDTNRTVFVPSEGAIEKMNKEDKDFWTSNENLPSLIKYHMVLGIYKLGDLQNLSSSSVLLTSLHRNSLHVSKRNEASPLRQCDGNSTVIEDAAIIASNIAATNGVIHIIDKVLTPDRGHSEALPDLLTQLDKMPECSIFRGYIIQYSLAKQIEGSSAYTVFVPSNNVIESFLKENGSTTLDENHIRYHIVLSEKLKKQDLQNGIHKETMLGFSYQLGFFLRESQLFVNDAQVNYTDVETSRGVIHGLGKVLQVQRNRCDQKTSTNTQGKCAACHLKADCPLGTEAVAGKSTSCINSHYILGKRFMYFGCRPVCVNTIIKKDCCTGFFGVQCESCPRVAGRPCFGNGVCQDGVNGTGVCNCKQGFTGTACENCETGKYGPSCDQVCNCTEHGECDEGDKGTGTCFCEKGWTGPLCETQLGEEQIRILRTIPVSASRSMREMEEHAQNKRMCECKSGYIGDGEDCAVKELPINRCAQNNGQCHTDAICTDLHFEDSTVGVFLLRSPQGQYKLVYEAAKEGCRQKGATIATYNQLSYAQQAGFHMCAAGWLAAERVAYPTAYSNPKCGFGQVGIVDYKVRSNLSETWDAYCYRMKTLDACESSNGGCSPKALCKRTTPGKRVCVCNAGYTGDGVVCLEINPCLVNNGGCHLNAECTHTGPSQSACNCISGYSGDGKICKSINPCFKKNGGCSEFAICNHTGPAERNCTCKSEYIGDGFKCKGTVYKANVVRDLAGQGPFTVFVPSSDAFKNEANIKQWDTRGLMPQILRYHMVACSQLQLSELNKTKTVTTLQGELITISYSQDSIFLNNKAKILSSDILSSNGIIHTIDKVLVPENLQVIPTGVFSSKLILAADLPNSEALKTLQGSDLHVNCGDEDNIGALFLNNRKCRIVQRQLEFSGGIAHGIDCMLAPPSVGGRCDTLDAVELMGDCGPCYKVPPCPTGSKPQKTTKNCVYSLLFKKSFDGCQQVCSVVIWRSKCCPGYFGVDCQAVTPVCSPSCSTSAVCKENNTCECKPFYEGDGRTCTVVNLCQQQNGRCAKEAHCTQKGVAVTCSCPKGYSGDGYTCVAIDPCVTDNGECHEHATCTMTGPNKRMCECKSGYIGDGEDCAVKELPINRCAQNNGQCHTDAICTDLHFEDSTVGVFLLRSPQGQYKLVYEAAKEGCRQKGATIATYNQLSYAQQAGFHMCAAGWLAAERVAYPTAYSNPKCGFGQQILTYSNNSQRGEEFVNRLSNLTIQATLFVPDNSALNENETLSERDIEYHLSYGSAIYFGDLTNGSKIPTRLGNSLFISGFTDLQNPSINSTTRYVNDRYIIDWDILAANGIIHVIQEPLQAPPPKPALHASHKAAIGVGLFLTVILIGLVGFAAYHYYSRRSRPFQFHYFKSDEGEDVAPIDVNPSICNPMYEAVCSPHSRDFDAVTDKHQVANSGPYDLLQDS
ncbi:UNVERIFIED_CONTAM: hypothetical protein FKN15_021979 [Acipenser sinensis]